MVDNSSRSALIQEQIRQLQQNAPPPVTDAERNQIMKGRKSQKDIDAGRAAVAERQLQVKNHQETISRLVEQLGVAQKEESAAATSAERERGADPWKSTYIPGATGAAAGFGVGEVANRIVGAADKSRARALLEIGEELGPTSDLTQSQLNRSRAMGAAAAAEKVAPTGRLARIGGSVGRAATYGIPSAVVLREWNRYQQLANDESVPFAERQSYQQMANFFLGTGTGIAAEGGMRFGNTVLPEGAGKALARVHTARDLAMRFDQRDASRGATALEPQAPPSAPPAPGLPPSRPIAGQTIDAQALPVEPRPQLPPPAAAPEVAPPPSVSPPTAAEPAGAAPAAAAPTQPESIRNSFRLRNAAVAASGGNVKSGLKKEAHYNIMKKRLTAQNLPDVAEALNMPRESTRASVLTRARELNNINSKSGLFLPIAAAGLAYALASSQRAEAADGTETGPSTADALTAGGTAAGTAYGVNRLIRALPAVARTATGMFGELSAPAMIDAATDYPQDELNDTRNWLARHLPKSLQFGKIGEAADMSEVPSPSPRRAAGGSASANAGDPDVARAWAKSPRATAIELTRGSGLDPDDIAHLAGVSADDVHSVLQGIPQTAMSR